MNELDVLIQILAWQKIIFGGIIFLCGIVAGSVFAGKYNL